MGHSTQPTHQPMGPAQPVLARRIQSRQGSKRSEPNDAWALAVLVAGSARGHRARSAGPSCTLRRRWCKKMRWRLHGQLKKVSEEEDRVRIAARAPSRLWHRPPRAGSVLLPCVAGEATHFVSFALDIDEWRMYLDLAIASS